MTLWSPCHRWQRQKERKKEEEQREGGGGGGGGGGERKTQKKKKKKIVKKKKKKKKRKERKKKKGGGWGGVGREEKRGKRESPKTTKQTLMWINLAYTTSARNRLGRIPGNMETTHDAPQSSFLFRFQRRRPRCLVALVYFIIIIIIIIIILSFFICIHTHLVSLEVEADGHDGNGREPGNVEKQVEVVNHLARKQLLG